MKNWKINIAFVLCAAFMFQTVFYNVLIQPTFAPQHALVSLKSSLAPLKKRKTQLEVAGNVETVEYSLAETREEEDTHEYSPQPLAHTLHSPLVDQASIKLTSIFPSNQYFSHYSSCRYLILQVLRT